MALPVRPRPEHLTTDPSFPPSNRPLDALAVLRVGRVSRLLTKRSKFRRDSLLGDRRGIDDLAHVTSMASTPIGSSGASWRIHWSFGHQRFLAVACSFTRCCGASLCVLDPRIWDTGSAPLQTVASPHLANGSVRIYDPGVVGETREVVIVLFTDVVGSTSLLSRLGDEAYDVVRRDHFAVLRDAISAHRGREVKSLGDGLMVEFGSAREAVACAGEMQRAVAAQPDALGLRVGIDAGEPIREDDDLFGTPVVVAKRLCDSASPGELLVSDLVRLLVGRRGSHRFQNLGPQELKGLDEPVVAHVVVWDEAPGDGGVVDAKSSRPEFRSVLARAAERPFIGRSRQLHELQAAWSAAREGAARVVVLAGEPGIGKTTLAAIAARGAYDDGGTVLLGRCHADTLVPYEPFVDALRQLPSKFLLDKRVVLGRIMPELARASSNIVGGDDAAARYLLFEAIANVFVDVARTAPILLVLEDLQWADESSLLLLKHVVRSNDTAALLIVVTYRTTEATHSRRVAASMADP
jgi:class 3 adenylate cyclase